jgi:hypothetical protein
MKQKQTHRLHERKQKEKKYMERKEKKRFWDF